MRSNVHQRSSPSLPLCPGMIPAGMRCRRSRDVLIRDQKDPWRENLKTGERFDVHTQIKFTLEHELTFVPTTGYNGYTLSLPFSLVDHRLNEEEREKERVASQKRRMPIIGNERPHLATFALLDVDTGLTDRPVNHHRFTLTFYRSHACSYLLYGSRLVIFVWPSNRPGTRMI